jgi:hypothetical protein
MEGIVQTGSFPRILILSICLVGMLTLESNSVESRRISAGWEFGYHSIAMDDYRNAKQAIFNDMALTMYQIRQIAHTTTTQYDSKFFYPTAFIESGLALSYTFPSNFVLSGRTYTGRTGQTDYFQYSDSGGNMLNVKYDWKMDVTDFGVGVGYCAYQAISRSVDAVLSATVGVYSLKYTEKGSFVGDARPAGGNYVNLPINLEKTYQKMYIEPSIAFPIYVSFSSPTKFTITPRISYTIAPSEKIDNYTYNVSGTKIGIVVGYTWQ